LRPPCRFEKTENNYWKYSIEDEDILSIPVINFNLEKNYESLEGNQLRSKDSKYHIETAYQRIALILDEKGAKVESEAEFAVATEEIEELPTPKRLILDRPFLLVFKRTDTDNPYLVAWMNNNELMIKK